MPTDWTDEVKKSYEDKRQEAVDKFFYNRMLISTNLLAAYKLDQAAAKTNITTGENGVTSAITDVSRMIGEMNTIIDTMRKSLENDKNELDTIKETVKTLEAEVAQEKTLNEIRKEQAESLAKKGSGNYHSTWMGLYRPLKEESRTGLAVAAVSFFLIFVTILVFAIINAGGIASLTKGLKNPIGVTPDLFSGFAQQKNRLFN